MGESSEDILIESEDKFPTIELDPNDNLRFVQVQNRAQENCGEHHSQGNEQPQQGNGIQPPVPEIEHEREEGETEEVVRLEESINYYKYPPPRRYYQKRERRPRPILGYKRLGGPGHYVRQVQSPLYPQRMPIYDPHYFNEGQ